VKLVEGHNLCLGCLTSGHGRTARACLYKEEQLEACQRPPCKAIHHHRLN
jgi:hypothetical protein